MKVLLKTILPITAGALLVASCSNKKAQAANNIPVYQSADENKSLLQAKLDSAAYRNIFNATSAAKDSNIVNQFNELAANLKSTFNELDLMLVDEQIPDYNMEDFNLSVDADTSCAYQHYADSKLYRKFFQRIGIMNDSISKQCDSIDKKTKLY